MGYLSDDLDKSTNLKQLLLQSNQLIRNFPPSYVDLHQLVNLSLVQSSSSQYRGLCLSLPSTWETLLSLECVSFCTSGYLHDYVAILVRAGKNYMSSQEHVSISLQC